MPEKITSTQPWLMERRYFSLIIASAFIILSAIAFSICYQHHTINTGQVLKDDRSAANLLSLLLDEHLKKIVSIMESYGNRPLLLAAVRDKNALKAKVHLISLIKSNPDIDSVIITDRQGTLWAAYPERPEVLGKNFAYRDWYKDVSKEWKSNISDVYLRVVAEKDLAVAVYVPLFDETGEAIGIMMDTHRTVGFSYFFKHKLLDPGQFITVTDRKGQVVYRSRHDVEKEIRPYPFYPGIKKAMAANNKTFAVDDPDLGGRTRYISFAPVTNIGWTVSVERDKRSILLSGSAYYVQVMVIAFLLFLSIVIFLLYSSKQVTAQQLLESVQAKEALRKSEAQLLAILDATPFPIALVDFQDNNINFWSHSALTLFGHTAPTAAEWYQIAYPDPDYQREVIERWKPFLEIARKSGQSVNMGEYRVTCSDGSARICELYVTFLTDKLMVTFNDITDRKRAEEAVQRKAEELRASNDELELFNLAATGRELRMIELKEEINELCRRLGEPPRHTTDPLETDSVPGAGL